MVGRKRETYLGGGVVKKIFCNVCDKEIKDKPVDVLTFNRANFDITVRFVWLGGLGQPEDADLCSTCAFHFLKSIAAAGRES
jgi:hypothetical protein